MQPPYYSASKDTRSSHEYLNDLGEEYQARDLLAKSKRSIKKEEVSSDDNEMVEVKVLMALAEENDVVSKEGARNGQKDIVFVKSSADDTKVTIPGVERPSLSEAEGFILPNHDTGCSSPRPPLKKLNSASPISGPKSIKLILRSKSTFKTKALIGVIINEPSSASTKGNKSSSALKVHSAPAGKPKSVKIKDDPLLLIVMKELINLKLEVSRNQSSYSRSKALQAKKAEALKSTRVESSNPNRSKTLTKRPVTPRSINHEKYTLVIVDESQDIKLKKPITSHYERPNAIKFSKPSVDNINIAKTDIYPLDEYLHPYEPSQRYSYFDYAGCNIDKKSTSGACQLLGGKLVNWSAKKQQSVAMSLAEAEYVAAAACCAKILWMKTQLIDYDIIYEKLLIFYDNTSAIAILNNPVLHSRTQHINIRYYFIRDHVLKGNIELHFIPTQCQLADIFTKPIDEPTFK
nr:retrovirus-related Pol polyprotein from transposon TNT 1-94 [Tanacetum cinerariifolium]